jgi:ABC-type multidrug transport system ATPase subunit
MNGLTKVFNGLVAVDDVGIIIDEGELFGLLGPNGAGKTTLIGMLSTMIMIPPTNGTARVWGGDYQKVYISIEKLIYLTYLHTFHLSILRRHL